MFLFPTKNYFPHSAVASKTVNTPRVQAEIGVKNCAFSNKKSQKIQILFE